MGNKGSTTLPPPPPPPPPPENFLQRVYDFFTMPGIKEPAEKFIRKNSGIDPNTLENLAKEMGIIKSKEDPVAFGKRRRRVSRKRSKSVRKTRKTRKSKASRKRRRSRRSRT